MLAAAIPGAAEANAASDCIAHLLNDPASLPFDMGPSGSRELLLEIDSLDLQGSESGEPDAAALEDYLGVEHYLELSFPAHLRPRSEEKKKEARCQPSSYSSLNACATPSPPLVAEA